MVIVFSIHCAVTLGLALIADHPLGEKGTSSSSSLLEILALGGFSAWSVVQFWLDLAHSGRSDGV